VAQRSHVLRWLVVVAAGVVVWLAATATPPAAQMVARASIGLAGWILLLVFSYSLWPASRVPRRLYHFTSTSAADAIVIAVRGDGTAEAVFRARGGRSACWLLPSRHPTRPRVYFFTRRPGRFGAWYHARGRHDECLEVLELGAGCGRVYRRPLTYVVAVDADVAAIVRRSPAGG
jgi:hypothetical protein